MTPEQFINLERFEMLQRGEHGVWTASANGVRAIGSSAQESVDQWKQVAKISINAHVQLAADIRAALEGVESK